MLVKQKPVLTVYIRGEVGSGKTTIANMLRCHFKKLGLIVKTKEQEKLVTLIVTINTQQEQNMTKSFTVIEEDSDTRIRNEDDDMGEHPTYASARQAAIKYLEELIRECTETLEELKRCKTLKQYDRVCEQS